MSNGLTTQVEQTAAVDADAIPFEPYYDRDGIVIYNADCRQVLPHLGEFDLVLTDPPYGIDYQSARRFGNQRKPKIHGDKEYPVWIFENLKPSVATLAFCRWDQLHLVPKPKSFIAWDKGRHSMGDLKHEYGRQWEACLFYPGERHAFTKRPVDVIRVDCVSPDKLMHPNEKPVALMQKLISHHQCQTILDPFMGSGTTLVAAKLEGRQAVGIEINEKYCESAANRLDQGVLF